MSFRRPPGDLLGEIEEELLDICGWSFVMLVRLGRLRSRMEEHSQAAAADRNGEASP